MSMFHNFQRPEILNVFEFTFQIKNAIKFVRYESCFVFNCVPGTFQEARERSLLSTTSVPDTVLKTEVDDGIGCKETGSGSSWFWCWFLERFLTHGRKLKTPPQMKIPSHSANSLP